MSIWAREGVLLIIAIVLGFVIWQDLTALPQANSLFVKTEAPLNRSISSVPDIPSADRIVMIDKKIGCPGAEREEPQLNSSNGFIRWAGSFCRKDIVLDKLKITNLSNGFTATIFRQVSKDSHFETDLIPLEAGLNQLAVSYESLKGEAFQEKFELFRSK